ncbi:MAG: hypothetical protein HZA00_14315 [Nitrospinae bacterium]|nr:hypothetical protein [Nitrospinota bacterium]
MALLLSIVFTTSPDRICPIFRFKTVSVVNFIDMSLMAGFDMLTGMPFILTISLM